MKGGGDPRKRNKTLEKKKPRGNYNHLGGLVKYWRVVPGLPSVPTKDESSGWRIWVCVCIGVCVCVCVRVCVCVARVEQEKIYLCWEKEVKKR